MLYNIEDKPTKNDKKKIKSSNLNFVDLVEFLQLHNG